jgi:acetyl esterase/lipase
MSSTKRAAWLYLLVAASLVAQQPVPHPTTAAEAPNRDTSYIDAQGTAHITRVVPIPEGLSPQAHAMLAQQMPDQGPPVTLAERRTFTDDYTFHDGLNWTKLCPNKLVNDTIAGVPVRIVTPDGMPESNRDKVLMNLHGGGFNSDSSSYSESIPMAGYTKTKVVAVLYRLAPEHPFPAAVDDAVAVYKELLKTYKPEHIVIYGSSAGAILTAEVAVRLKQLALPMPAAMGIFSGMGDFAHGGDSQAMYSAGLSGHLDPPTPGPQFSEYAGTTDPKDPVLSPIYADLHGLPPTLFVTSGRDVLLSGTANLQRAFLHAGVDTQMVLFDGLPHGFWNDSRIPEAIEVSHIMADFFIKHLGTQVTQLDAANPNQ